jgi:hypothetical protein
VVNAVSVLEERCEGRLPTGFTCPPAGVAVELARPWPRLVSVVLTAPPAHDVPSVDSESADDSRSPWPALAPGVASALSRLLAAAHAPTGDGGSGAAQALQLVEAVDVVQSWAEELGVRAVAELYAQIRSAVVDEVDLADMPPTRRRREEDAVADSVCAELEAATGAGQGVCRRRVAFAMAPVTRTGRARALLWRGQCSGYRARVVFEETSDLPAAAADEIAADVLSPRPDGAPWSHRQFRRRLAASKRRHADPDTGAREHAAAVAARSASAVLGEDGTGQLWVSGEGPRVVAAMGRVDVLARRFRGGGDPRTLAQLRSDVALDLLLYGWVRSTDARGGAGGGEGVSGDPMAGYRRLGEPPVAHVELVVSLTTLLGLEDGVGVLSGQDEVVPAAQARQIAMVPGSVWSRIVTDPVTGRCLERSRTGYRFDAETAAQIRARDGLCRGPGCTVPADRCDIDHERPWALDGQGRPVGGPTSEANGVSKHRRHHNLKTRGHWSSELQDDGALVWSTVAGRSYTTWPMDYRGLTGTDPDGPPISIRTGRRPPAPRPASGATGPPGSGSRFPGLPQLDRRFEGPPPF